MTWACHTSFKTAFLSAKRRSRSLDGLTGTVRDWSLRQAKTTAEQICMIQIEGCSIRIWGGSCECFCQTLRNTGIHGCRVNQVSQTVPVRGSSKFYVPFAAAIVRFAGLVGNPLRGFRSTPNINLPLASAIFFASGFLLKDVDGMASSWF